MLFNSYFFLFAFLPAALLAYSIAGRFGNNCQLFSLLLASIMFYGWWDVRFLALLGTSITANFTIGRLLATSQRDSRASGWILGLGVALNLLALGIFKYANFFVETLNMIGNSNLYIAKLILPLGISFFTFEQIGYLVDIRRGAAYRADFLRYALFVAFFPRLVAGPILRYSEMAPQFDRDRQRHRIDDLGVGLTIFVFGLVKKSFLADGVAPYASDVFATAAAGEPVDLLFAWGGALAYTCQLYFDFSGYSDMAIGAARCFGIRFPVNFASPYKSASIIEFWRRWHITLSRFLRDYLYFSLGGNRRGPVRRYANLLITMLLGGLWHGANWTFVAWGGLHGTYLIINHAWLAASERSSGVARFRRSFAGAAFGFFLTFVAVVVGWVLFRATSFAAATDILRGMIGLNGISLPSGVAFILRPLHEFIPSISFSDSSATQLAKTYLWVVALLGIAFFLPNTQQLLAAYEPVLEMSPQRQAIGRRNPSAESLFFPKYWAVVTGVLAFLGIISITRVSEFLYWQF